MKTSTPGSLISSRLFSREDIWFSPEEIISLGAAYDQACKALGLLDPEDPRSEIIAETILATAQRGVRDPSRLQDFALSRVRL